MSDFYDLEESEATDSEITLDDVGTWAKRKHEILEYYTRPYSSITAQFTRYYVDGFANRGLNRLRNSGEVIVGSALRALQIANPFDHYIFVEENADRAADLRRATSGNRNVEVITGDANEVLPSQVFPRIRYERRERALCFLDPYRMQALRWETIKAAGSNVAVDAVIHFPTMDAQRTVLMSDPSQIRERMRAKMSRYWGDDSWFEGAYSSKGMLPMEGMLPVKNRPEDIIEAFQERLKVGAGFNYVSKGLPVRNSIHAVIYHLLVASHNKKARDIFRPLETRFLDA